MTLGSSERYGPRGARRTGVPTERAPRVQQTAIGLGGHQHLAGSLHMLSDELVEPSDILDAFRQASRGQLPAGFVLDQQVLMRFGPVVADEYPFRQTAEVIAYRDAHDVGGYRRFTSRGRVFAYGNAAFMGDLGGTKLNGPLLGSVATPSDRGYYTVATDRGIFDFSTKPFVASLGGNRPGNPIIATTPLNQ